MCIPRSRYEELTEQAAAVAQQQQQATALDQLYTIRAPRNRTAGKKTHNHLLRCHFMLKNDRSFCQDRLGTNIGKAKLKKRLVFSQLFKALVPSLSW